ncbi:zinc-dependent metalloprotease [Ferrimonas marina]|uniref:DUF5117 domain-containing protein n=1 Tax=Ferrimonas marina TaxID=299255 RepID=A0A1M5ZM27_9GAMM|nr:zinc-dependent metalloprotease [Ferrimonas marina]SHI24983.1 protein of unknown function [Ferrimonas marina]
MLSRISLGLLAGLLWAVSGGGLAADARWIELQQSPDGRVSAALPPLDTPMLMVTSLPYGLGSNDVGLDRGQLGSRRLVQFERHGERVLLRQLNPRFRAVSDNPAERQSVVQAFAESVLWVGTLQQDQLDLTPLLLQDWHGIAARLQQSEQGSYQLDTERSLVLSDAIKAFPRNSDAEVQLTFRSAEPGPQVQAVAADPSLVSLRVRYSFVALPEEPMTPRLFHPEVGYFSYSYADYAQPLDVPMTVRLLPRHRLEKLVPGEAPSKVKEPIVYYLDPATPEPVRSALLDGARWWAEAFEAAGFIDAYRVELLPPEADPQDIRYNMIQWVHRSTRGWSYGDSLIDPRSGEILKGHVTLGSLRVRQDHKIFRGLTAGWADRLGAMAMSEQAALARLRQLSAHEVGHTLGLAHNFAASANGDRSVMDYPHPRIERIDERLDLSQAYGTGLSDWDRFAIAYGYGEASQLPQRLEQARNDGLLFLSDPDARGYHSAHPLAHLWDNGTDPVAQLNEVMAIRQQALAQLGPQALLPGEPNSALGELLTPLYLMHRYQVEAASALLGGVDYNYQGAGQSFVTPEWQRDALQGLKASLAPEALMLPEPLRQSWVPLAYGSEPNRELFASRLGPVQDPLGLAEVAARLTLEAVLDPARLNRLQAQSWLETDLPGPETLMAELADSLLALGSEGYRGAVQARVAAVWIDTLLQRYHDPKVAPEVRAALYARLSQDAEQLERQARRGDKRVRAQQSLMANTIRAGLEDAAVRMIAEPLPVPPGSPI